MFLVEIIFYSFIGLFVKYFKNSGLSFFDYIKSFCVEVRRQPGKIISPFESNESDKKINHEELNEANKNLKEQNNFLNINNVTRKYDELIAVNNFSGELFKNEIFCLLGHNGAGKTTLIKMISGVEDPDEGDIFLNGNSIITNKNYLYHNIGVCLQDDIFFDYLTVAEQLKYILEIRGEKGNYENDMQIMQQNFEKISHDNDSLKSDLINLNKNLNLLTNQNETYAKEINELKIAFEKQQKPQYNEEEIKKLMEELNFYKIKAQENDLLAKQIEALKDQMQQLTQFQEQEQEEEEAKEVKGDIIHDMNELELLTKKINKDNKRLIINLLYKASADGDTASAFHEKCDEANNTIVLVETKDGKRFGGYTTCSWKGNCIEKADPDAFIFSFDKMKTYDNIPEDDAIGCYPKFGPIFLGCQIKIFDNAFTKGGTTFEKELNFDTKEDYELTGGNRTFEVKDIEVYEVVIEDLNN